MHKYNMQIVPVTAMTRRSLQRQIYTSIDVHKLLKQLLYTYVRHAMLGGLFGNIRFNDFPFLSAEASDGVMRLKCFWMVVANSILQSTLEPLNDEKGAGGR
jgi:hypothetical protein